jgi:hypothetical protein
MQLSSGWIFLTVGAVDYPAYLIRIYPGLNKTDNTLVA